MVSMRSYEYMDPARVLEIRGEDCTNCAHLGTWKFGGKAVITCCNDNAPAKKRAEAPASRCYLWKHRQGEKI